MKSITDTAISRRQAVALGASAFATLGLAACGSSNSSDSGSPSKKSGGVKIKEETAEDSAKKLFQLLSDASII